VEHERLALLAPRSHGKSTTAIAFVLWQCWRHGRDPATGQPIVGPVGRYSVVLFSATREQAAALFATLRDLVAANPALFGTPGPGGTGGVIRWSAKHVGFANGAEISTRAYRISSRGIHPDLLVLDDVLSDANSLGSHQRDLTWRYLVATLLPMHPGRIVIVGSAFHADDLFHRLAPLADGAAVHGFAWVRYAALNEEDGTALWPGHHPASELTAFRDAEPTVFSREYQNEPRDDAASIFPYELTGRALEAGRELTFVPFYDKPPGELIMLGADFAISEKAGSDSTVILVTAVDWATGRRRLLFAERHKGFDILDDVERFVALCRRYRVDVGVVEQNGFQKFLLDALRPYPDVFSRIHGHTTGREKGDPVDGVLGLKLVLRQGDWVLPSGDEESRRFGRIWQAEMAAFGWTDGRLRGLGEHDDTVLAMWFVELANRYARDLLDRAEDNRVYTLEDLGIRSYRISAEWDAEEARLGPFPNEWDEFEMIERILRWRAEHEDD
jgi:hypothetical protein